MSMTYLTPKKQGKILTGDTFQIANRAKEAKKVNPNVIDATVGALFLENGSFYAYETVLKTIDEIPVARHHAYAPTSGGAPFKTNVMDWVFQKHNPFVQANFKFDVVATPGATGALYNTFVNYMGENDLLIMPDIYWTNYLVMLDHVGAKATTYQMFDGQKFNLKGFKEKVLDVYQKSKKIVCLFNDPAHNPTGYSMHLDEWKAVYQFLNELSNQGAEVIVIYDLAYIDYEGISFESSRDVFLALSEIQSDLLAMVCFSGSKSFSLYGLRVGAQIALSKNDTVIKAFTNASIYSARATWSCPPATGIHLINDLFGNDLKKKAFLDELEVSRKVLRERADLFIKEADQVKLDMYPYKGGFFITIPVQDPDDAFEKLAEIGLYTIPVDHGVRIAISSIPLAKIKGMAKQIKESLTK
jgi:aromatic-amino-acid transaminase